MSLSSIGRFFLMLTRKKMIPVKGSENNGPLKRTLSLFDLCLYGIGAMCGGYIYGVSIVLVATKSGASSFLSNIIAGIVAALNAQCYAELSSRFPLVGGGYSFTYMICGELLAFLTAWAMLLEYLLAFAFASVGAANAIDVLSNHRINAALGKAIGHIPDTHGYLTDVPNVLAATVAIFIVILLGFGAKISVGVNSFVTISSTAILMVCSVYMAANSNIRQFSSFRVLNLTVSSEQRSDWMPFGIVGVIGGAALTFNAFIGFDALCLTGAVVLNPRRNIPLSTNIAIISVFIITTFYYLCVSFYRPWFMVDPTLGLSGIFYKQGIYPMQIVAGIGEITGYATSGFASMLALSHIVFSLSQDGLLFPCFHYITATFQVPIFTNIIFGLLAAMLAMLLDLNMLANFMSAGTLITYTVVAIDLLIIRLFNVEKFEITLPDDKDESPLSIKDISFTPCLEEHCRSTPIFTRPVCLILSIIVLIVSCSVVSSLGPSNILKFEGRVIVISVCSFLVVTSCFILFLFKYYVPEGGFNVRPVPLVPIVCVILNIFLASNLQILVWYRIIVWLSLGLICYGLYGIWHSTINLGDGESMALINDNSSKILVSKSK